MHVAVERAQALQILGRPLAELGQRIVDLVDALAEMGVDLDVERARRVAHRLDELGRAGHDLAQRQPGLHAVGAALGALPALHQPDIAVQRLLGGGDHGLGPVLALVDRIERDEAPDAGVDRGAAHGVGMRPARLGKAGRADRDHVGVAQQARQIDVLVRQHALERHVVVPPHRNLHRPAAVDLGDLAAQQGLRRVDMRIDQAGHGDLARAVDRRRRRDVALGGRGLADPGDLVALDRDGAVADDRFLPSIVTTSHPLSSRSTFRGACHGSALLQRGVHFLHDREVAELVDLRQLVAARRPWRRHTSAPRWCRGRAPAAARPGLAGFLSMAYCSSFWRVCCLRSRPRSAPYLVTQSLAATDGSLRSSVQPRVRRAQELHDRRAGRTAGRRAARTPGWRRT